MAMESTAQHRTNIPQVVSTHPTLSTVLTPRDPRQVLILTRAVQQSKAVDRLGSHTLSINIITILAHTVKGVLVILLDRTLTTAKEGMQCLQILHTRLASLSIQTLRLMHGPTLVHMHPHNSNGSPASSLHKTTMEIPSVQHILQLGQELELVLRHLISLSRTNSTSVPHRWDQNPGRQHPQIPPMENLLK